MMDLFQKEMLLKTDAEFTGAVCCILAKKQGATAATIREMGERIYQQFKPTLSGYEELDISEMTDAEVHDILLCTARTAARLLEET